jgi:hypothetical protein
MTVAYGSATFRSHALLVDGFRVATGREDVGRPHASRADI